MIIGILASAVFTAGAVILVGKTPRMVNTVNKRKKKLMGDLKTYIDLKDKVESSQETTTHERERAKLIKSIIRKARFIARHRGATVSLPKEQLKKLYRKTLKFKPNDREAEIDKLAEDLRNVYAGGFGMRYSTIAKKIHKKMDKVPQGTAFNAIIKWGENEDVNLSSTQSYDAFAKTIGKLEEFKEMISHDIAYDEYKYVNLDHNLKDPIKLQINYLEKKREPVVRTIKNLDDLTSVIDGYWQNVIDTQAFNENPVAYMNLWNKFRKTNLLECLCVKAKNSTDPKTSPDYERLMKVKNALVKAGYSFTARRKLDKNDLIMKADVENVNKPKSEVEEGLKIRTSKVNYSLEPVDGSILVAVPFESFDLFETRYDILKKIFEIKNANSPRFPYKIVIDLPGTSKKQVTIENEGKENSFCRNLFLELEKKSSVTNEFLNKTATLKADNTTLVTIEYPEDIRNNYVSDYFFSSKDAKEATSNRMLEAIRESKDSGVERFPFMINFGKTRKMISTETEETKFIKDNLGKKTYAPSRTV